MGIEITRQVETPEDGGTRATTVRGSAVLSPPPEPAGTPASGANRRGRWLTAITILIAAGLDVLYGAEASLIVPLVFGPFVASALTSVRDTVASAAVATLVGALLGLTDATFGSSPHLVRVGSVAVGGCLAVWLAVQRTDREAKLQSMRHVAEVAQHAILRPIPPEIRGVRLAARYLSASTDARIGGDFYEAVDTPWGVRLMVGDVRGKGLDAVHLASTLLGEFRSRAPSEASLSEVANAADAAGRRVGDYSGEDFATAILVQLDGDVATIVRCGHPAPLVAEQGQVRPIDTGVSLPLCLGTEAVAEQVRLSPGSRMLLFSDGAFEGRDEQGRFFDLRSSVAEHAGAANLATVLDKVVADLARHCRGGISDDVVLVIVELPA